MFLYIRGRVGAMIWKTTAPTAGCLPSRLLQAGRRHRPAAVVVVAAVSSRFFDRTVVVAAVGQHLAAMSRTSGFGDLGLLGRGRGGHRFLHQHRRSGRHRTAVWYGRSCPDQNELLQAVPHYI